MPSDLLADPDVEKRSAWRVHPIRRSLFVLMLLLFALFWIWALFFASKTAVNKIEDRAWAARAEQICAEVRPQLQALEAQASNDLAVRAGLVRQSTDMLASGKDGPFTETAVQSVPVTERIETFAGDNLMPSCAPPRGSVL